MKKISLFKSTPRVDWYKVPGPGAVDQKLIDSLDWPVEKPYVCFIFPRTKLDPAKPLRFKVSRKYMGNVRVFTPARTLKLPPEPASLAGITVRPPKSLAELKRVNRLDHAAHLKRDGKKAGYSAWNEYKAYEKTFMPKATALMFFRKGKFFGLAVHFPHDIFNVGKRDHLGWHVSFKGLNPAERRSAEYQQALWLKKTARRGLTLSLGDGESYKFFARMGLTADRIGYERL